MCALVACVPERSTERKPRHFSTLCPSLDGLFLLYRNGIMRTCPQSNSFRCFCTVSVCQYVYYWLHLVRTKSSENLLLCRFLLSRSGIFSRDNTDGTRNNSFRCFCTVSVCQYVYFCLHRVAARQSSRRLASMQGARIKACGSFPPQIVLALTLSKITRRCLALRRFAGTPKQNHPKISCSEDRFLSFRSGIFPQDNTGGTRCNSFRCFCTVSVCQYVYYWLHLVRTKSSENLLLYHSAQVSQTETKSKRHFGSEFLTNSLSMRFTILGGFIQTIFISLPPCTH